MRAEPRRDACTKDDMRGWEYADKGERGIWEDGGRAGGKLLWYEPHRGEMNLDVGLELESVDSVKAFPTEAGLPMGSYSSGSSGRRGGCCAFTLHSARASFSWERELVIEISSGESEGRSFRS